MKPRLLLADDETAIVKVTKARLEHEGFEVVQAADGEEALKQAMSNGGFDLILLDIKMPKYDGFQVVKKLRENPLTAKIPVILFTASSQRWQEITAKCAELGIADFLKKPFDSKELVEKIRRVLNKKIKSAPEASRKPKILLVDDEPFIVKTVAKRLETENFEVLLASNGQEALDKARDEKPDLIILDLMLPKMDGYKVCSFLKKDTRYAKIPVVMFTARVQQSDEKLGLDCGADAYIRKPFNSQELLDRIKGLLDKSSPC